MAAFLVLATGSAWVPAATAAPPAECRLLGDPATRQRMGGLLFQLQRRCGAAAEPGPASASGALAGPAEDDLAGAARGDLPISAPGLDVAARFGSHTQAQTSLARSEATGTLCAGYDDSYHLLTEEAGFSGYSRAAAGQPWSDRGALGSDAGGEASLAWRHSDGAFYFAALHSGGLGLWKSADDCLTFQFASLIYSGAAADRPRLAIDNHPASGFYGRIYAAYTDFASGRIVVASSNDGLSWSFGTAVSAAGDTVQSGWPAIAPNGLVFVAWLRWQTFPDGPISIRLARSANGGFSFGLLTPPLAAGTVPRDPVATANCARAALAGNIRNVPAPQFAVADDHYLHVVYSRDPDGEGPGDASDVYYRRSINGGATWSPERRINDDATGADQFAPALAVGPGKNVTITWYDRRLDPANLQLDRYSRSSFDGGVTWGPNVRISDVSSPIRLDPELPACYHGDYDQVLATPDFAIASWSDDRQVQDGHPDADVYSGRIALPIFGDGFESGSTDVWNATFP